MRWARFAAACISRLVGENSARTASGDAPMYSARAMRPTRSIDSLSTGSCIARHRPDALGELVHAALRFLHEGSEGRELGAVRPVR